MGSVCQVTSCVLKVEGNTSHKSSVSFCVCGNKLRYFSCHLNRGNKDKVGSCKKLKFAANVMSHH